MSLVSMVCSFGTKYASFIKPPGETEAKCMKIEKSMQKIWTEAHSELKNSMQKEIGVMRELLANMYEEEMTLCRHDKTAWDRVMQDRFFMIRRLGSLRAERQMATEKLEEMASLGEKGKKVAVEQILPESDENSSDIFFLLDQIMALTSKMNRQNSRNQSLFNQGFSSAPQYAYLPQPIQQKRKNTIATYPDHEEG